MTFEIRPSNNARQPFYWRIVSSGRVLASSETYTSREGCLNAIAIVQRAASGAEIYDYTRAA